MGVVRTMATSGTAETTATVLAARIAARLDRGLTSGAPIAASPHASDPEMEIAVARLRRLRERGLLTAHEFEVALDRVTAPWRCQ